MHGQCKGGKPSKQHKQGSRKVLIQAHGCTLVPTAVPVIATAPASTFSFTPAASTLFERQGFKTSASNGAINTINASTASMPVSKPIAPVTSIAPIPSIPSMTPFLPQVSPILPFDTTARTLQNLLAQVDLKEELKLPSSLESKTTTTLQSSASEKENAQAAPISQKKQESLARENPQSQNAPISQKKQESLADVLQVDTVSVDNNASCSTFRTLVHCIDGLAARQALIDRALAANIQVTLPPRNHGNPWAVRLSAANREALDTFVSTLDAKTHAIFYNHDDERATRARYRAHFRTAPDQKAATPSTFHIDVNASTGDYGNTATAMARHYHYPTPEQVQQKARKRPILGILSFGGHVRSQDLYTYWKQILGLSTLPRVVHVSVDGARYTFGQDAGGDLENTIDLEIAGGMCPTAVLLLFSAPNTDMGLYDAIGTAYAGVRVGNTRLQPSVVCLSWGTLESGLQLSTLQALNQLLTHATTHHGVTFCVSAGDSGSADGVDFPASAQSVVACGGTSIDADGQERAWTYNSKYRWGTGGGFSSVLAAPDYQMGLTVDASTTKAVITTTTPPPPPTPRHSVVHLGHMHRLMLLRNGTSSMRSAGASAATTAVPVTRRAIPDVAMLANPLKGKGWTVFFNDSLYINGVGGTSCVAPAVGALVAMMGRRFPTSFNFSLYALYRNPKTRAACFVDIVQGSSNDDADPTSGEYRPTVGFDLCTGLGVLNGTALYEALKSTTPS